MTILKHNNNVYLWKLNVGERYDEMMKTTACVIVNEIAGYNATYVKEIPCHFTVMARVNSVSCLLASLSSLGEY